MVNIFTGESQNINFTKGERTLARIDPKGSSDVYYVDDDGWGAVFSKELIEIE